MKYLAIVALVLLSACNILDDPCGLTCDSDTGACKCEPHSGSSPQFWIRTPFPVHFYRCDCTFSRFGGSVHGEPIPSDPSRGECYAIVVSVVLPGDCETSFNSSGGYNPCVHKSNLGGAVACGNPP